MDYIKKHWKGDLSLAKSFWINLVLIYVLQTFLWKLLEHGTYTIYPPFESGIYLVAIIFSTLILFPWQIVGVWRSCNRYVENKGVRAWSLLAKITVIFGILVIVSSININFPVYVDLYRLAFQKDPLTNYSIELLKDNTIIHASGTYGFGISGDIKNILKTTPTITGIILNSEGGRIYEGRELFKIIKKHNLSTFTSKGCYSACAIAFIAGNKRILSETSNIALHQYKTVTYNSFNPIVDYKKEQKIDENLYRNQGVSDAFIEKMFATQSDDLWYPTHDELLAATVVHQVVPASNILPQKYTDTDDLTYELANELFQEYSAFQAIYKYEPELYESLVNKMLGRLKAGASNTELVHDGGKLLESIFTKYIPITSDEAIINFVIAMTEGLHTLNQNNPIDCIKYLYSDSFGAPDISIFTQDQHLLFQDLMNQVIVDAYTKNNPDIDSLLGEETLNKILEKLGDKNNYIEPINLQNKQDYSNTCDATFTFYELYLEEEKNIAANGLRYIFSLEE